MKTQGLFKIIISAISMIFCTAGPLGVYGQWKIEVMDSSQATCSFRGLSVVSNQVLWVSGSRGTVGRSVDGGKSWNWTRVSGFEKADFRDIEAFDEDRAIIMASGTPALVLKTGDGGRNWKLVFRDDRPEMFLDAMDFWDEQHGVILGDPVQGHFTLLLSSNGGESWSLQDTAFCPQALDSESVFAASGTCLRTYEPGVCRFVSGGRHSRLFQSSDWGKTWQLNRIPLVQGQNSQGAFSLSGYVDDGINKQLICITGGDYQRDSLSAEQGWPSSAWWRCTQQQWFRAKFYTDVHGYRSCVEAIAPG